jgi:hypothetical protein
MPESSNLTSDKFAILLALDNSLYAFANTSLFASPDVIRERQGHVIAEFRKLEEAFPETAKHAKDYYEEVIDESPLLEERRSFEGSLFYLLLACHNFTNLENMREVSEQIMNIRGTLIDFACWFEEFDSEIHFC